MTKSLKNERLVIGIVASVLTATGLVQTFGQQPEQQLQLVDRSLDELQRERQQVLAQLVEVQMRSYVQGDAGIEVVVHAQQQLLAAKLQLASNHQERIKLLKDSVQLARDLEDVVKARHKVGRSSVADMLLSRADRLRVESELVRESQKVKDE